MARPSTLASRLSPCALAACLVAATFAVAACDSDEGRLGPVGPIGGVEENEGVPGSGNIVAEVRDVAEFDEIRFESEGRVVVASGGAAAATVETDDNLLERIVTEVSGGRLVIRTSEGVDIAPSVPPVFTITLPQLTGLELAGAGSIDVDSVAGERFTVSLSGVGDITIDSIGVDELVVDMRGVGNVSLTGVARSHDAYVAGVTTYAAAELESADATIEGAGNGHAVVWARDRLDVTASANSTVEYYGMPTVDQQVSESASIISLGAK